MGKVLHYKTNYLNKSETFIQRLVQNHRDYSPQALCFKGKYFTDHVPLFEAPEKGFNKWLNFTAFHLNFPLPFFYKTIKKIQPDIIHAHFGFDGMKMMRLAALLDIPLVVSFYGSDVSRLPSEFGWKRRYRKLGKHGSCFIAASELMKSQLCELGFPEEKIEIVRFGVDLKTFTFNQSYLLRPKMMMVGRMVEKKGFRYAIEATSNLRNMGIDAELNLYGDGPLLGELQQLSHNLGLEDHVHFHGFLPNDSILEAHEKNSFLLAPSVKAEDGDMEGLPNTILEGMASGTPVVATKHAAIPEAITNEETGFLVEEKDIHAFTTVLKDLIEGKYDLEKVRKQARRVIEKQYSVQNMVTHIEHIYNQEIQKHGKQQIKTAD